MTSPYVECPGDDGADQSPVEDEAAPVDHEDFGPRGAGIERVLHQAVPVGDGVVGTRAEDRAEDEPGAGIEDRSRWDLIALGTAAGGPEPEEKAGGEEKPVP